MSFFNVESWERCLWLRMWEWRWWAHALSAKKFRFGWVVSILYMHAVNSEVNHKKGRGRERGYEQREGRQRSCRSFHYIVLRLTIQKSVESVQLLEKLDINKHHGKKFLLDLGPWSCGFKPGSWQVLWKMSNLQTNG